MYAIEPIPRLAWQLRDKYNSRGKGTILSHAGPADAPCRTCYVQPFDIIKHMTSTAEHGPEAVAGPASGNQRRTAVDFGDIRREFAALVSGCGVFDISTRAKVEITGRDRV